MIDRAGIAASRGPMATFIGIGIVWGAFMATLPDLKDALSIGDGALGLVLIFGSIAAIAMMLAAPRLGGLLGALALPVGGAAMGMALMLPAQAGSPAWFAGAMLAMGGSSGAADVWMNARLATIEAARRMKLMNLNHAIYSFAYAGAAAVTGLARAAGIAPSTILTVAGVLVLALALAAVERDGKIDGFGRQRAAGPARSLGPVPVLAGLLALTAFLTENAGEAWSALYIERDLGAATGQGSYGPALMAVAMGLGRLAGQAMAARVADRTLLRGGLIVAAFGAAAVAAAPGVIAAYAAFMLMGLGISVVVPTALAVAGRLAEPAARSRAIARTTVLGYLGFFLGPPVLGFVAEMAGLRASYGLVAALLLGGLALQMRLARLDR
jgi:hypothetical protein